MAEFPALPIWTDALIGDTFHLTPAQFGAYLRLLIAAWRRRDCALPNDDEFLGRVIGDPHNWKRIKPSVISFFHVGEDGLLHQKRLSRERDFVSRKVESAREAGLASALKRKGMTSTTVATALQRNANETATPTPTPILPSLSNTESNPVDTEKASISANCDLSKANGSHSVEDEFDAWYATYPKHVAKGAARRAYRAARKKADAATLLAKAAEYAKARETEDPGFTAQPSTWLNGERWLDSAPAKPLSRYDQYKLRKAQNQ